MIQDLKVIILTFTVKPIYVKAKASKQKKLPEKRGFSQWIFKTPLCFVSTIFRENFGRKHAGRAFRGTQKAEIPFRWQSFSG